MLENLFFKSSFLLTNYIENEQNFIVGPIAAFLGYILNFLYEIVRFVTIENSMGIAIILLTIVARTLMLPLGFKQQKSMVSMRRIQPETEKIKAKYAGNKDPEIQRKMSAEIQALYTKNNINPFSGCLPMLITLPIFFALSYLMRESYMFVNELGGIYDGISKLLADPLNNKTEFPQLMTTFTDIIRTKIQPNSGLKIDTEVIADLSKVLNKCSMADWQVLFDQLKAIPGNTYSEIYALFLKKRQIENLFGIDIVEAAGWLWPGVIIPILTGVTTFLSTWIMNKQQDSKDSAMKTQQIMMLVVMPIMMTTMTAGFSSGVGIYWIVSSIYQTIQQIFLNKYYMKRSPEITGIIDAKEVKPIITVDKSKNNKKGAK